MMQLIQDTKDMFHDKVFLGKAFKIACPVAMQGMLNTVVNLADTMMIGTLGATAIAAVGLANKFFFVFTLLVFGVVSGSGVLAAQYWGNGDVKNIRKVLGLSLSIALGGAALFVLAGLLSPSGVMRIFTESEASIRLGAAYLAVVVLSYPFTAVTNVFVAMLRAVGKVTAPVATSCMAICTNIFFNFLFIFPERAVLIGGRSITIPGLGLGVVGAAYATLIARILEMAVLLTVTYWKRWPVAARLREMIGYEKAFVAQFIRTASPVILNEFMWGLGTTMYSLAYGRMGDDAVAAITIATTIQDIVVVLFQGLSAATAVILGNEMGAGKLKRAEKYATYFFILQFLVTVTGGLLIAAGRWQVIGFYKITPQVAADVSALILIFVAYMPAKMFNYVNVVGVLRSGGDTKMCLFLDTSGVWAIGVPLAFLGGLVWKLTICQVYALVMLEEVYKMVLGYWRYRQKKWLKNLAAELG
ncbi:MAG: MATE family efflux transporter [Lachnospiraceae bacterium]|nr:MATE family efflux transporter [Lachnospiraceae bacterium]